MLSSDSKASACNAGDPASIPGSGRFPGEGNGNPLQYSCLENPTDRGGWWATVHGGHKEVRHDLETKTRRGVQRDAMDQSNLEEELVSALSRETEAQR